MKRHVLGILAGLAAWLIVATIAGFIVRWSWPAYVRVAESMMFTLPMQIARLSIGAIATLAMGYVTARITRSTMARLAPGVLLLLAFIPEHAMLWDKFPVWYHLTFLSTLVPLTYAGARIADGVGTGIRSDRAASA